MKMIGRLGLAVSLLAVFAAPAAAQGDAQAALAKNSMCIGSLDISR